MRNFCANKTTNERFARRANTALSDGSRSGSMASSTHTSSMVSARNDSSDNYAESMLDKQN